MSTFNNVSGLVNANESHLFPTLPSTIRDSRYSGTAWTIVPSRTRSASLLSYQSRGWTISAHQGGKHYAYTKSDSWAGTPITIVTEAHVVQPGVSDQLNAWLAIIHNVITKKHIHLPESSHLFLDIHQDSCAYYFVDHALHTIFWLHTLEKICVGSPSLDHLRHPLQENYWIHVDLFPETASEYSALALKELNIVLRLARKEADPSGRPASPYTREGCEGFIEALEHDKGNASSPHVTTYIARLWATIESHRSFIYFESKRCLVLTVVSKVLLFGLPNDHRAAFESLCADQLIHTPRWREYVSESAGDLGKEVALSLALLSGNIFMLQISSFPTMAKLSLILCVLSVMVASILLHKQRRRVCRNRTTSAVSASYGFQPMAIVYSLPKALFLWSLLLLAIQHYRMAAPSMPVIYPLSLFLLAVVLHLVVRVVARTHSS